MWTKNRGMFLESIINKTLKFYSVNNVAIFHKKNLDITFTGIKRDENGKPQIKKGWVSGKSTTDYYGIYDGRFITFEAKSTNATSLPLQNIKMHQMEYMKKIHNLGGLSFIIIYFGVINSFFLISIDKLELLKKKSLSPEFVERHGYKISIVYPGIIDFLSIIDMIK